MTNVQSVIRSLITYAVCLPLAVFLGYLLTNPLDYGTFFVLGIVLAIISAPFLLRYHYHLMLLFWGTTAVLFFVPGRPPAWLLFTALSFMISYTGRLMNPELRGISVPQLTRPLIAIIVVVLITAKLTGGIGLRTFGGDTYGGKRYFFLLFSIVGYFAMTAQRIPRERVPLCLGLFFLSALPNVIGDLFSVLGDSLSFLYWVFPIYSSGEIQVGTTRLGGMAAAAFGLFSYMMARYGIRGIFLAGRPGRAILFVLFCGLGMLGGFRSLLITFLGIFALQFYMEGLQRTKLLPALMLSVILVAVLGLPFVSKLPMTLQRSLAFLPIDIDPVARQSAQVSSEWRLNMWKAVLPQVPQYLFLGKGLGMSHQDFTYATDFSGRAITEDQLGSALAGDYHNGPLSLIIPFGIWGVIAFVWFLVAGFKVLYNNYRYGDAELRSVNIFLLVTFIVRVGMFCFVVGGFHSDLQVYVGILGLSVAINGGVAQPAPANPLKSTERPRRIPTILRGPRPSFSK